MNKFERYVPTKRMVDAVDDLPLDKHKQGTPHTIITDSNGVVDGAIWSVGLCLVETGDVIEAQIHDGLTLGRAVAEDYEQAHLNVCEISSLGDHVSRIHAGIYVRDGQIVIQDLGSTNGTFLNGYKIIPFTERVLNVSDRIRIGLVNMLVSDIKPITS